MRIEDFTKELSAAVRNVVLESRGSGSSSSVPEVYVYVDIDGVFHNAVVRHSSIGVIISANV